MGITPRRLLVGCCIVLESQLESGLKQLRVTISLLTLGLPDKLHDRWDRSVILDARSDNVNYCDQCCCEYIVHSANQIQMFLKTRSITEWLVIESGVIERVLARLVININTLMARGDACASGDELDVVYWRASVSPALGMLAGETIETPRCRYYTDFIDGWKQFIHTYVHTFIVLWQP